MNILIFGGTGFLGRHLVNAALERNHHLTLFNRGQSAPDLFPDLEQIHANRDGGLAHLEGRRWDAVIDSNGRIPRLVREAAHTLANAADHYTFISSISVYAEPPTDTTEEVTEDLPPIKLPDESVEEVTNETYGGLKFLCEEAARETFPGKVLIIRPGLIVGPDDTTDRFTYWPHRVARGGEVLAPGDPEQKTQFIDARDLANWTIRMIENQQTGIYNATGPEIRPSLREILELSRSLSGSSARFTWVDEPFIEEHKLEAYTELPLWVPAKDSLFLKASNTRAREAGLTFRPLSETIQATLAWDTTRPSDLKLKAGISSEREQELLKLWHARTSQSNKNS